MNSQIPRSQILCANTQNFLWQMPRKPFYQLVFLSSIGMSSIDLAKTVSYNPTLLHRSLQNDIIPCYIYHKRLLITDANVLFVIRQNSSFWWGNSPFDVTANIRLITELGMPSNCIAYLVKVNTELVTKEHQVFSQIVSNVKGMGFDPTKMCFVQAMAVLALRKTAWRAKEETYKRWGWSESDIRSASRMFPQCMVVSEEKIMGVMELLVNKMGWESRKVAEYPYVFSYSLENRIIPRCSVIRVLLLKGLIEVKTLSLASVSSCREEHFLSRFVIRYLDRVPQLLNVYRRK